MKLKPIFHFLLVFASALSFIYLIPQSFIHSDSIIHFLVKTTRLKVDPSFTGGETVASFRDPLNDDNGAGTLRYPSHSAWNDTGLLDLMAYSVHRPLTKANWSELPRYWQLDCSFAKLPNPLDGPAGFSHPVIHIYIDIDGAEGGSVSTLSERGEMVSFDEQFPWDYMVHIDGFSSEGTLYHWEGEKVAKVLIYLDTETSTVKARIPLEDEGLLRILDGRVTRHYVLIGAYDQLSTDNFMPITRGGGIHSGGGAESPFTPKVYDLLVPAGESQQLILASFSRDGSCLALLKPVIADPEVQGTIIPPELLEELKNRAAEEEAAGMVNPIALVIPEEKSEAMTDTGWLISLFNTERKEEAYALSKRLLEADPENGIVLAYAGSLEALRAGATTDVAESINLVNTAFECFKRAEQLLESDQDLLHLYFNRGFVCLSVPEIVFNKGDQGGVDFMKVAEILKKEGSDDIRIVDAYLHAGACYEKALKDLKAETAYSEALGLEGMSARQRLTLAEKGFY